VSNTLTSFEGPPSAYQLVVRADVGREHRVGLVANLGDPFARFNV
jgi:hypothetical protein